MFLARNCIFKSHEIFFQDSFYCLSIALKNSCAKNDKIMRYLLTRPDGFIGIICKCNLTKVHCQWQRCSVHNYLNSNGKVRAVLKEYLCARRRRLLLFLHVIHDNLMFTNFGGQVPVKVVWPKCRRAFQDITARVSWLVSVQLISCLLNLE